MHLNDHLFVKVLFIWFAVRIFNEFYQFVHVLISVLDLRVGCGMYMLLIVKVLIIAYHFSLQFGLV